MQSAEDMRAHLTAKAAEDSAFRAQLVADPKGIMNQEFGITVPDNIDIVVHESDMRTVHLALPPDPSWTRSSSKRFPPGFAAAASERHKALPARPPAGPGRFSVWIIRARLLK